MTTYADMRNRIADEIQDTNLNTQINFAIQDAIKLYQSKRFYFNQTSGTFVTVANQEFYGSAALADIPNIIEIDFMHINLNNTLLAMYPVDAASIDAAQNGSVVDDPPRKYAYYGQQIRLFGLPGTSGRTITLYYHTRLAALSGDSDTNAWMVDGEILIRQAAKRILNEDVVKDDEEAARAGQLEKNAFDALQAETAKRISNPYLRCDPALMRRRPLFNILSGW